MALKIYNQFGVLKATIEPADNSTQTLGIMSDNVLGLSFTHHKFIMPEINDYTDFMGCRYWLMDVNVPKQKNTVEWNYSLNFYGIESLIKRFLVLHDGNPEFALTAPAHEHAALIVNCINDGIGSTDWKVGGVVATDNITIDYTGLYCDEALKELADQAEVEWWVEGQTINISRCEHGEEISLAYGRGITSLERDTADNVKFYTRLFPIGSGRNIDPVKYGHNCLQLPGGKKYVDIHTEKYGIIHHYEKDAFSGIYPSRVGEVSSVRHVEVVDDDGNPYTIYYFKDSGLNFDPNNYEIGGLVKQVTFQSGELSGREFEVNFNTKNKEFEIITTWPYEDGTQIPGGLLVPKPTDKYILWNISMPDEYYPETEQKFLQAVEEYNRKHGIDVSVYKCPTDYIFISENKYDLFLGRRIKLDSREYFPELGYRRSRITKITRKINNPAQADLEISDALSTGVLQKIEDSIAEVETHIKTSSGALPDIIRTADNTLPTDNNLYSARRSRLEFIKKQINDTVLGILTFIKRQIFREGAQFGESFAPGLTGTGGLIDGKGNGELESLSIRRFLEVPEIRFNRTDITIGNSWRAPGAGIIESVDTVNRIVTLKLADGEIGAVAVGDICMGIFHSLTTTENSTQDSDDSKGNFTFAGFVTSYFTVTEVLETNNRRFRYQLRPTSSGWKHTFHPREAMHFVGYGNFTNQERQTSMYETRTYRRMLWRQSTWEISIANIASQDGDLTNLNIHGLNMEGYSSYLNSVYFTGVIKQVKPDGTPVLTANDRGKWKAGKYDYYDRVSHNGGLWLCVNEDGTSTEPAGDNNNWLLQVSPGKDGQDGQDAEPGKDGEKGDSVSYVGNWQEDKFIPYLGIIRINEASWICTNKNGTTCSYMVLTDSDDADLTDESGSDLLSDEIDMSDFSLVADDGEDGKNGVDGTDIEFVYTRTVSYTRPATPATAQQNDYVPAGWTDSPEGVTEINLYEWVSVRHKDAGQWSVFSTPSVWAKWGEKGQDGDGLEYIYRLTPAYVNPARPASSPEDGYVPSGWTDDPAGVTDALPYEWVCQRKKRNGVWGDFSLPAVWARYSKDGKDGEPGSKGDPGDSITYAGDWQEDKFVPYLGVIRINSASWMCAKENGTTCSYMVLTDSDGADLTDEYDYDLLSDEIDMDDFVLVAEDGQTGEDGVGIESVAEHYYLSSSATTLTGGAWVSSRPAWKNGWYIWTRKVFTFTNGRTVTTEPICVSGAKGDNGIQGCIIRIAEWRVAVEWRNDEGLTEGTRYLDIALVRDLSLETGWQAYKCKITHTSAAGSAPGNAAYWEPFGLNVNAIFTSLIIAKNAVLDFMQGNQLLIKKDDGTVTAGLSGAQTGDKVRIWAGGANPNTANFRVNELGQVYASDGTFRGRIEATSGNIAGFDITSEGIIYDGSTGGSPIISITTGRNKVIVGKKGVNNVWGYISSYAQVYVENNDNPNDYLDGKEASVGIVVKSNYVTEKPSRKLSMYADGNIWCRNLFQQAGVARAVYKTVGTSTRFYVDGSDSEFLFNFSHATNWLLRLSLNTYIGVSLPNREAIRTMMSIYWDGRSDSELNTYITNYFGIVFSVVMETGSLNKIQLTGNSDFKLRDNNGNIWNGDNGKVDMSAGDALTLMFKSGNYYILSHKT